MDEIKIRIEFEIISNIKIRLITGGLTSKLKKDNFKEKIAKTKEKIAESKVKKGKKISLLLVI